MTFAGFLFFLMGLIVFAIGIQMLRRSVSSRLPRRTQEEIWCLKSMVKARAKRAVKAARGSEPTRVVDVQYGRVRDREHFAVVLTDASKKVAGKVEAEMRRSPHEVLIIVQERGHEFVHHP